MARLPWIEIVALAVAALILSVILFVPPPVGLADDGDFARVILAFDLVPVLPPGDPSYFHYIVVHYRFDPAAHWWGQLPSSEMVLIYPALAINRLISKRGDFDLRAMGVVHAAIFLLALALYLSLIRHGPPLRRALLAAAAIFVFCDVVYISYYNSFYTDTPALLFLLLAAVFFARIATSQQPRAADGIGFVLSAFLLVTAKSQHSLFGLAIVPLLYLQGRKRTAVVLATLSLMWILQGPLDYSATARYNLIFYRVLPQAPDRSRALREFGLDDSYASKIGKYAYNADSGMVDQEWVRRFDARATYARLLLYYLRHPATPLLMLGAALDDAAFQRIRLGNYARNAGKLPAAQSYSFAIWSTLKQAIFSSRGWLYAIYCFSVCALLPTLARGRRELLVGAIALVAVALMALGIGCLGDGLDYLRHLFIFNACIDMLGLACLSWLTLPHAPRGGRL